MKESKQQRSSDPAGPESWADARKDDDQALTGGHAGWVLSCERQSPQGELRISGAPTPSETVEGNIRDGAMRAGAEPCAVIDPTHAWTHRDGNREIPRPPARRGAGRIGKSKDVRR